MVSLIQVAFVKVYAQNHPPVATKLMHTLPRIGDRIKIPGSPIEFKVAQVIWNLEEGNHAGSDVTVLVENYGR
jgi:hypothetical protein